MTLRREVPGAALAKERLKAQAFSDVLPFLLVVVAVITSIGVMRHGPRTVAIVGLSVCGLVALRYLTRDKRVFGAPSRKERRALRFAEAPVRPCSAAADSGVEGGGEARFRGVVAPLGEPLVAPVSGRPCVAYALSIVERSIARTRDGTHTQTGTSFHLREADDSVIPFVLRDETGEVLVNLGKLGALYTDLEDTVTEFDRESEEHKLVMTLYDMNVTAVYDARRLEEFESNTWNGTRVRVEFTFVERCVPVGARVEVAGMLAPNDDWARAAKVVEVDATDYRSAPKLPLVLGPAGGGIMTLRLVR